MRHKTPNAVPMSRMARPSNKASLSKINNNTFVFMASRASNLKVRKSPRQKSDKSTDKAYMSPFDIQASNEQERFNES